MNNGAGLQPTPPQEGHHLRQQLFLTKRTLHQGDNSTVILAESLLDGQPVVLKRVAMAGSEDELHASVPRHPNIVTLHHHFVQGCPDAPEDKVMVLEWCEHGDLEQWRTRVHCSRPVAASECLHVYRDVSEGLRHLHANGIVHRDIKPKNIFVSSDRTGLVFKVGDFGIARRLSATGTNGCEDGGLGEQRMAQTAIGTPYYLAPELVRGHGYDYAVDWWALGCVLYELSQPPGAKTFRGHTIHELLRNIREQPAPTTGIADIDHVLRFLLSKEPLCRRPPCAQTEPGDCATLDYEELCRLAGKERVDRFLSRQPGPKYALNGSSTLAVQKEQLREAILQKMPEEDLEGVLGILQRQRGSIMDGQLESELVECVGRRRHQQYRTLYALCWELSGLLSKSS